jgi:Skp family chaperone for outer membrane proteins
MEFRVVDFELITRHYKAYKDGVDEIEKYKEDVLKRVDPLKKEMNSIVAAASGGIVVDTLTQQQRVERFQKLQADAVELDKEAKFKINKMANELNVKVYDELEELINEWAKENDIDMIIGKMEVVHVKEQYDISNKILDILKEKEIWVEYIESKKEKESV